MLILLVVTYAPVVLSAAAPIASTFELVPAHVVYPGIASAVIYSSMGWIVWIYKAVHSATLTGHARVLFVSHSFRAGALMR